MASALAGGNIGRTLSGERFIEMMVRKIALGAGVALIVLVGVLGGVAWAVVVLAAEVAIGAFMALHGEPIDPARWIRQRKYGSDTKRD